MKYDLFDGPTKWAQKRLYAAQKLLCASELGLSCPSSGGRNPTHVAALSARFQSVV